MPSHDGRTPDDLRSVSLQTDFVSSAAGSCLVSFGRTRVLCCASVDGGTPRWLAGTGKGWVTAEYSMLPGCAGDRIARESAKGKIKGRTHGMQRLVARSLRACVDLAALGERQIIVDCDVIEADGGTRTASITGAYVALDHCTDEAGAPYSAPDERRVQISGPGTPRSPSRRPPRNDGPAPE